MINFCEKCDAAIIGDGVVCVACEPHKFKKGENEGSISYHKPNGYLALTATQSKWFKTYRGALNFMERNGYKRIQTEG